MFGSSKPKPVAHLILSSGDCLYENDIVCPEYNVTYLVRASQKNTTQIARRDARNYVPYVVAEWERGHWSEKVKMPACGGRELRLRFLLECCC